MQGKGHANIANHWQMYTLPISDKSIDQISAKIEVRNNDESKVLTCFSPLIHEITQSLPSVESLLFSERFSAKYTNTGIITSVSHS